MTFSTLGHTSSHPRILWNLTPWSAAMGYKPNIQRLIGDLVRLGTVASVNPVKTTYSVRLVIMLQL